MFDSLILFLCNTIKYLEVTDLTLTRTVMLGLKCSRIEAAFQWGGVERGLDVGRECLQLTKGDYEVLFIRFRFSHCNLK